MAMSRPPMMSTVEAVGLVTAFASAPILKGARPTITMNGADRAKNSHSQRKPGFLESPELAHGAAHPSVVPAFLRQGAREFADHERSRQTPQDGSQQQNQYSSSVAGAVHDVFRAIRAARHHKEGGGDQGPQGEPAEFFVLGKNEGLFLLGWRASGCQFLWLPPRATHSHHPVSVVAGLAVTAIPRIR